MAGLNSNKQAAESVRKVSPRTLIAVAVCAIGVLGVWCAHDRSVARNVTAKGFGASHEGSSRSEGASCDIESLETQIRDLKRRLTLLEETTRNSPGPNTLSKASSDGVVTQSSQLSEEEQQEAKFQQLESALDDSGGDIRPVRTSEATMRQELNTALGDEARILDLKCGAAVCRATFEEDTALHVVNTSSLIDSVPSLKSEAMFSYEREGTLKRTTVYVARIGRPLPLRRDPKESPPPPPPPPNFDGA